MVQLTEEQLEHFHKIKEHFKKSYENAKERERKVLREYPKDELNRYRI